MNTKDAYPVPTIPGYLICFNSDALLGGSAPEALFQRIGNILNHHVQYRPTTGPGTRPLDSLLGGILPGPRLSTGFEQFALLRIHSRIAGQSG